MRAQYRLATEGLGVARLRLVMGTSMGGMHTWLWGQRHPQAMDALMPLASLPDQISGRNRAWRRVAIDAIRTDPAWQQGTYTTQPRGLRTVAQMLWLAGSNPVIRQRAAPTLADTDRVLDAYVDAYVKTADANDVLYAFEAPCAYDRARGLGKIVAPLVAINSADDHHQPAGARHPRGGHHPAAPRRGHRGCRSARERSATPRTRWRACGRNTCQRCWRRRPRSD